MHIWLSSVWVGSRAFSFTPHKTGKYVIPARFYHTFSKNSVSLNSKTLYSFCVFIFSSYTLYAPVQSMKFYLKTGGIRPFSVNLRNWWRWTVNSAPWALGSHRNKGSIVLKAALDIPEEKKKQLSTVGMEQWNLCPPNCSLVSIPNLITLVWFISPFKVLRHRLQHKTAHKHHPHPPFVINRFGSQQL